jgi:hypothetical protein
MLLEEHFEELRDLVTLGERQGRQGRRRRGPQGHRGRRVRLRDAQPADGRERQGRRPRHRQRLLPLPVGGGCGHNPVQLPLHGAAVDAARRHRRRQHLHPQALREDAALCHKARRAARRGGAARGRLQHRQRRARRRWTASSSTRA